MKTPIRNLLSRRASALRLWSLLMIPSLYAAEGILYTAEGDTTQATDRLPDDGAQNGVMVNHVTVTTDPAFGTNAYAFGTTDPDPDALDIPGATDLGAAFTLSAFVKPTASGHQRLLSDLSGDYALILDMDPGGTVLGANLRMIVNGTQVKASFSTDLLDGAYHHIAAIYEAGLVTLYVDGQQVTQYMTSGTGAVTLKRDLRFGEDVGGTVNNEQFTGQMDDLLILKTALTANQVAALATNGAVSYLENPVVPTVETTDIGRRRELFLDDLLIASRTGVELVLQTPVDEGVVFRFDQPWEGNATTYVTVIQDGDLYRMYYRGQPTESSADAATCYAESTDGIHWTRPNLGLHEVQGTLQNNVILMAADRNDSFAPFLDTNPDALPSERFKATASGSGSPANTLVGYTSPDGIHWTNTEGVILTGFEFDSLNVAFWSEAEGQYLCYYRDWVNNVRRIGRAVASDFGSFTSEGLMDYDYPNGGAPATYEQHYINGTHPYARAPHHYIALAANLFGTDGETDALYMSARPGRLVYDRLFPDRYVVPAPEIGDQIIRSNFAAENTVQTGPRELSFYISHKYRTADNHLRRYSLRLDGFVAASATNGVGELITKPIVFAGDQLQLNYRVRSGGSLKVELQDAEGNPITGYALADAVALTGDEIDGRVTWTGGSSLGALAGTPVRIRFVMEQADLFAMQFELPVTNLPATEVLETSATLNAELAEAATVRLFRGTRANADNGTWDQQQDLGARDAGTLSVPVDSLQPDTAYAYTFGVAHDTGFLMADPVQTFSTAFTAQHTPAHPTATPIDDSSIRLTWEDRSQTETRFRIERSLDGTAWELDQLTAANATTAVSGGLLPSTRYWFRVFAENAIHRSEASPTTDATTEAVPLPKRLLYNAEEGDGPQALDRLDADGGQHGVFTGQVAGGGANAKFGSAAYAFTGVGLPHVIDLPGTSRLGDAFTLSVFVDTANPAKRQRLFSSYPGSGGVAANVLLLDYTSTELRLILNGTTLTAALPVSAADGWYHHVAVTYDRGQARLYFDGQLLTQGAAGAGEVRLNHDLRFGEDLGGTADENFVGDADEVLVLSFALDDAGMASLVNLGGQAWLDSVDRDEDQMSDWEEERAGTSPTDPASQFLADVQPREAGGMEISWPSLENRTYTVERSTDLFGFDLFQSGILATPPLNRLSVPDSPGLQVFRVRIDP